MTNYTQTYTKTCGSLNKTKKSGYYLQVLNNNIWQHYWQNHQGKKVTTLPGAIN